MILSFDTSQNKNKDVLVSKFRQSRSRWVRFVAVAAPLLALSPAPTAADTETVTVEVTFIDRIQISKSNALTLALAEQDVASIGSITVSSDVADPSSNGNAVQSPHAAASMTIAATPDREITIRVDSVHLGAGYTLTDFRCSYGALVEMPCDGTGLPGAAVASDSLRVGATLIGDGTAVNGNSDASFEVTIAYQ